MIGDPPVQINQIWQYDSAFTNNIWTGHVIEISKDLIIFNDNTMYDRKAFINSRRWKYIGIRQLSRLELILRNVT